MVELVVSFLTIIFLMSSIGLGIFLLMYKRKDVPHVYPDWFYKISPEAQQVHLNQWEKKNAPLFTSRWFMEYWKGERSAFSAWFVWGFIGNLVFVIGGLIFFTIFFDFTGINGTFALLIVSALYSLISSIILWNCAKNSTRGYKYFARFIAVTSALSLISNFI